MQDWIDDLKDQFFKDDRVEELRQLAQKMKFTFLAKQRFSEQAFEIKDFRIFKGKKAKRFKGILSTQLVELGLKVRIYDYVYFGDEGKKTTTIFEFQSKNLQFPRVRIQRKKTTDFLKKLFKNSPDLPYPGWDYLHKKYTIQCENPFRFEEAINIFFLEELLQQPEISVEGEDDHLIFYLPKKKLPVKEIPKYYEWSLKQIKLLKYNPEDDYV